MTEKNEETPFPLFYWELSTPLQFDQKVDAKYQPLEAKLYGTTVGSEFSEFQVSSASTV